MKFGVNDVLTFGKHKGKTLKDVLATEAHWACWLREEKKKSGQPTPFTKEAHDAIDACIKSSRTLKKQYAVWNMGDANLEQMLGGRVMEAQEEAQRHQAELNERDLAYAGEWGAW